MASQSMYILARQGEKITFTKAESHREAAKIFGEQFWEKRSYSGEEKIAVTDSSIELTFTVSKNMDTGVTEAIPQDPEKETLVVLAQSLRILLATMGKITKLSMKTLKDPSMSPATFFTKTMVSGLGKPMLEATESLEITKSYLHVLDRYLREYDTMKIKNSEEMVSWFEKKASGN